MKKYLLVCESYFDMTYGIGFIEKIKNSFFEETIFLSEF